MVVQTRMKESKGEDPMEETGISCSERDDSPRNKIIRTSVFFFLLPFFFNVDNHMDKIYRIVIILRKKLYAFI